MTDLKEIAATIKILPAVLEAGDFVHEWPFHDQDHIQQILDILKLSYLPNMSDTMRRALTSDDS